MSGFKKATKKNSRLRLALTVPSGAGKTYSALAIGTGLCENAGGNGRIAVIDTERGSAAKYSDIFDFDVMEIGIFDPRNLIDAIKMAEDAGYPVIITDSLTHYWNGKGGILEMVEAAKVKSKSGNAYTEGWSKATPIQNSMYEAILGSTSHIIATMRATTEYVLDVDPRTGKSAPKKIGMKPVQREGIIYEFDIEGDIDTDHNLIVGKTRWSAIDGQVIPKAGVDFGRKLSLWLSDAPLTRETTLEPLTPTGRKLVDYSAVPVGLVTPEVVAKLKEVIEKIGMAREQIIAELARRSAAKFDQLTLMDARAWLYELESVASVEDFKEQIGLPDGVVGDEGGEAVQEEVGATGVVVAQDGVDGSVKAEDAKGDAAPIAPALPDGQPADNTPPDAPSDPSDDFEIADQARPPAREKKKAAKSETDRAPSIEHAPELAPVS